MLVAEALLLLLLHRDVPKLGIESDLHPQNCRELYLGGAGQQMQQRKGKERKSIYMAPFCTKVHTKRSGMDNTVLPANNTMPAFPS